LKPDRIITKKVVENSEENVVFENYFEGKMKRIFLRFILFMLTLNQAAVAQDLKALGAPDNPKVNISWNRFYSTEEIGENLQKLAKAYPDLAKTYVIGESVSGREIRVIIC